MKLRYYISAFVAAALAIPAAAQNLDPTVNVTRAYEGKLLEVDKPSFKMAVPDSVMKFGLDFDYSVLDRQYKGGNDFNPYLQDIRPEEKPAKDTRFWLRAGAGFTFHPEVDFVWNPVRREHFRMNVYGTHRSYLGKYREITRISSDKGDKLKAQPWFSKDRNENTYQGFDSYTKAGLNGRYNWQSGSFLFDAAYIGMDARDSLLQRGYNAAEVVARVKSNNNDSEYFYYDAELRYRYGVQKFNGRAMTPTVASLAEHRFTTDATVGQVFSYYHSVLMDVDVDVAAYVSDGPYSNISKLALTPKYRFSKDRFDIEAGLKVEFLLRPQVTEGVVAMSQTKGQIVYPKIDVNFHAVTDYLNIYLRADGGADINAYSSLLERNHWFNANYAVAGLPQLDNSIQRVHARLGVDGNVNHVFSYDFRVGYMNYSNLSIDNLAMVDGHMLPVVAYAPRQLAYTALDFGVNAGAIGVDGRIFWNYAFCSKNTADDLRIGFKPSPLSGDLKVSYNWKNRLIFATTIDASLGRKGRVDLGEGYQLLTVPGYIDLGFDCNYVINRKLSAWAKIGNVGCMQIQRSLLYAESGPYFTLGICLNL